MKPCSGPPATSTYWPTMKPLGLMPNAMVANAVTVLPETSVIVTSNEIRGDPSPRSTLCQGDPRVRKPEEQQDDLHRRRPPMLESIESIRQTVLGGREESLVAAAVGHEWHDRHEREGRMKAAPIQRGPRESPGTEHVRPEAANLPSREPKSGQHGRGHENAQRREREGARWVEHRQDHQSQRVVGYGQQE